MTSETNRQTDLSAEHPTERAYLDIRLQPVDLSDTLEQAKKLADAKTARVSLFSRIGLVVAGVAAGATTAVVAGSGTTGLAVASGATLAAAVGAAAGGFLSMNARRRDARTLDEVRDILANLPLPPDEASHPKGDASPPSRSEVGLLNASVSQENVAPLNQPSQSEVAQLSPSELLVLRYLMTNLSNGEIATAMSLSVNTIYHYIRNIYAKLGANDRSSAVQRARDLRLQPAGPTKHPEDQQ